MAHIAGIAVETRAALVSVAALVALAMMPWRVEQRNGSCACGWMVVTTPGVDLSIELPDVVPMPNSAGPGSPHPDARPWPHGMVIHPPPSHDRNLLRRQAPPSPTDLVMAAFLQVVRPVRA